MNFYLLQIIICVHIFAKPTYISAHLNRLQQKIVSQEKFSNSRISFHSKVSQNFKQNSWHKIKMGKLWGHIDTFENYKLEFLLRNFNESNFKKDENRSGFWRNILHVSTVEEVENESLKLARFPAIWIWTPGNDSDIVEGGIKRNSFFHICMQSCEKVTNDGDSPNINVNGIQVSDVKYNKDGYVTELAQECLNVSDKTDYNFENFWKPKNSENKFTLILDSIKGTITFKINDKLVASRSNFWKKCGGGRNLPVYISSNTNGVADGDIKILKYEEYLEGQ